MRQWIRQPLYWSIIMIVHFVMLPVVLVVASVTMLPYASGFLIVPVLLVILLSSTGLSMTTVSLIMMAVPGTAIGLMYRRKASALVSMTAGVLTMVVVLVAFLAVLSMTTGMHLQHEIRMYLVEHQALLDNLASSNTLTEEKLDSFIAMAVRLLPLYIIMISVCYTVMTHAVNRRLLNRLGFEAASLPPVHEWRLPRVLIWYYLIVHLLHLMIPPESALYTFIINLYPILLVAFAVQGIALYSFWAFVKGHGKGLPAAACVLCVFFPPLLYLTSLVGVIDTGFPIRQYIRD